MYICYVSFTPFHTTEQRWRPVICTGIGKTSRNHTWAFSFTGTQKAWGKRRGQRGGQPTAPHLSQLWMRRDATATSSASSSPLAALSLTGLNQHSSFGPHLNVNWHKLEKVTPNFKKLAQVQFLLPARYYNRHQQTRFTVYLIEIHLTAVVGTVSSSKKFR